MCDELVTSWCFRVCMYMMQFCNVMLLFLCFDFFFFLRPHCNFSFEIIKLTLPYLTLPYLTLPYLKFNGLALFWLPRRQDMSFGFSSVVCLSLLFLCLFDCVLWIFCIFVFVCVAVVVVVVVVVSLDKMLMLPHWNRRRYRML